MNRNAATCWPTWFFDAATKPRCAWPLPRCPERPTEQRQMLSYCEPHAAAVDANRSEMTGPR